VEQYCWALGLRVLNHMRVFHDNNIPLAYQVHCLHHDVVRLSLFLGIQIALAERVVECSRETKHDRSYDRYFVPVMRFVPMLVALGVRLAGESGPAEIGGVEHNGGADQ
jgi:hypothetical protein